MMHLCDPSPGIGQTRACPSMRASSHVCDALTRITQMRRESFVPQSYQVISMPVQAVYSKKILIYTDSLWTARLTLS